MSPDPNHVEILRSGPPAWNAWREKNPSTVPELAGIALKLSERQMGPTNGGPINLKSARLQNAFLRFATLLAADLEAADMPGVDLVHARLGDANLSAANLSNALLDHADFAGANLARVNLCGASLRFATLPTADLEFADMSGADLMHARFDHANLSAANLSNALLDHADFAGANLAKVNLSGASLYYAKNLTQAQLDKCIGSDSTILPPHLRGSVSWPMARSQTGTMALKPRKPTRAQHAADVAIPHTSSYNHRVWGLGVLLIGGALVATGFVWQHMNEAVPLRGSERSLTEPKLSLDTGEQRLQPSAPEALTEEKAEAERGPSADAEIPPMSSGASTVVQTETTLEQHPAPETDRVTLPQETNADSELPVSDGAKLSAEASVPRSHEEGPELKSKEASEASALASEESPSATASRNGTGPDLPAEASIPDPQVHPAAEPSAEALAVNTPEPAASSSLNDTPSPPIATAALPSSVDAETVLPHDAETPPKPVTKPVIQKGEVKSKPARRHPTKGQSFVDEKAEQRPGSGSIVDLLAGGL